jgi:hypothetical protein
LTVFFSFGFVAGGFLTTFCSILQCENPQGGKLEILTPNSLCAVVQSFALRGPPIKVQVLANTRQHRGVKDGQGSD